MTTGWWVVCEENKVSDLTKKARILVTLVARWIATITTNKITNEENWGEIMNKAYKFRLYPNKEQKYIFQMFWLCEIYIQSNVGG